MTCALPIRSLLDDGALPIADIARIARKEGRRPRPVYQAHKWFARRFAITARALAVAAATPSGGDFWKAYYGKPSAKPITVLDPFMGGGVMLLEAARLGASVIGVDVEPVAATVADFQGRLWDLPPLDGALDRLKIEVATRMAPFYATQNEEGERERMLHAFWVQVVACGGCGAEFDVHPEYRFAWNEDDGVQWVACRKCSAVSKGRLSAATVKCGCGTRTRAVDGRCPGGVATCPTCQRSERLIDVADRMGKPTFRLFAVETIPDGAERRYTNRIRRLRSASECDREAFRAAERALAEVLLADGDALPKGPIPREGRSDDRLLRYGYSNYSDLFNARQRLHLALLGAAVGAIEDVRIREAIAIAFSDHLTTNNMLCGYAGGWRRLSPLFAIRAFRHIARPVELNPWLEHNGRGTFPNAVRSIRRAAEALAESEEPTLLGPARKVPLRKPASWDIRCADARSLGHVPNQSVDLVLTDPPYFDYIAYSELGHFFVPWLVKLGLVEPRHLAHFPEGQLASPARSKSAADDFATRLSQAMREIARVMKPEGRIAFTYQNLDGRGWRALGAAMASAGLRPFMAFPLLGDGSVGLHRHANSISWDCVVVARKWVPFELEWSEGAESGAAFALEWSNALEAKGHALGPGDIENLRHVGTLLDACSCQSRANVRA